MPKLTNEEIDKVRSEHKAECREQFYQAASKGFLTWGSVALVANAILHYTWPVWKNKVGISGKTFLIGSAATAGFAVYGETAELECSRRLIEKIRPPRPQPQPTGNKQAEK